MSVLLPGRWRSVPVCGALVSLLYLLALAAYPQAALIVDSGRDLAWGVSIARGDAMPLYGPGLNGIWQLGPAWYYLLAGLLGIGGSIGATAWLLGMLAAAKIPLMYRLGFELKGSATGLACAAAISLPGWSSLGALVLSHTMLVETLVLATLLAALLALVRDRIALAIGASLLAALSIHAHPAAVVALPAAAWMVWRTLWRPGRRAWLLLAAAAFALPFLPALVVEARSGWPQLQGTADYFGATDYLARLQRLPRVMLGASLGQLQLVQQFLVPPGPWGSGASVLMAVAFLAAAAGVLRRLRDDATTRVALALGCVAWGLLVALREITPAWMTFACAPLGASLLGIGWQALWPSRWQQRAAVAVAVLALLLSGLFLAERFRVVQGGLQYLPSAALVDIAVPPHRDPPVRFWMPAWGHDSVARLLCDGSGDVSLHGDLAAAMNFGQGVAAALHCDLAEQVLLGGEAPRRVVGVPSDLARKLGLEGDATDFGYELLDAKRIVHPPRGVPMRLHTRYRADEFAALAALHANGVALAAVVQVDEPCSAADLLLVTNLLPGLNHPFGMTQPSGVNSMPATTQTLATSYLACPPSGRFGLQVRSFDPASLDIVMVTRAVPPD